MLREHIIWAGAKVVEEHVERIRAMLNDFPETNTFVEGVEFSDNDIKKALLWTLKRFNQKPPVTTTYTEDNMPFLYCWYIGTVAELLRQLIVKESVVPAFASGAVSHSTRKPYLEQLLQIYESRYNEMASGIKHVLNLAGGYSNETYEYGVW